MIFKLNKAKNQTFVYDKLKYYDVINRIQNKLKKNKIYFIFISFHLNFNLKIGKTVRWTCLKRGQQSTLIKQIDKHTRKKEYK